MNGARQFRLPTGRLARTGALLLTLTRQDLRNRYVGATLGLAWSFLQPLVMALVLWFVFAVALRARPVAGVSYVAWFLAALAPWSCFSESLPAATQAFREFAYLVTKVRFEIAILPLVKILASAAVHLLFLLVVMGILLAGGVRPTWFWLQTLYYLAALVLLTQALAWITAPLNVFLRDTAYGLQVLLQLGFWVTPIFWDFAMIPPRLQGASLLLHLNPMAYIVRGYRRSLIEGAPFWNDGWWALYFWTFTAVTWLAGWRLFRRLRPHFADVL